MRKAARISGEALERLQQAFFGADFAMQADIFTRVYDAVNNGRRLKELGRVGACGRALEVGVGRGSLLATLRESGFDVEGIDLSRDVCARAAARAKVRVHCSTLEDFAATERARSFDLVMMCHVLEHIEGVRDALSAARTVLRPRGLLYVAVPNVDAWQSRLPGWTGFEPYHVHYFNAGRLAKVLVETGFEVVRCATHEPLSGWFNALSRSALRRVPDLGQTAPPTGEARAGALVRFVYNVLRIGTGVALTPVRWAQAAAGFGEELVVIARTAEARSGTRG